ncbi:unnamed protein product [Hyaloperonospora brassicae]|uniref:RING-type domain-containing protein n=1 Tax=Hyaloperonospora brassicae TaxID=162125 RepID=A0AAV0V046_HYABA|nr:unnamed protein product [Hyaloperonospora brassicae]
MAFRGVLLQLDEATRANGFQVLTRTAELTLPRPPAPLHEPIVTTWSHQQLVVIDGKSRDVLCIARLATVALQAEEQSILWSRRPTQERPSGKDIAAIESDAAGQEVKKKKEEEEEEEVTLEGGRPAVEERPRRCYCFRFGSEFEYELFARTLAALTRMQRYALVQSSVVLEMAIAYEDKKWRQDEGVRLQAAATKAQHRLELRRRKRKEEEERARKQQEKVAKTNKRTTHMVPIKSRARTTAVAVVSPRTMRCVLCRVPRQRDAPEFPKHPFVLKDGKGEVVHICKVCLQRVLQLRLATQALVKKSREDNYCGLCAQPTEKLPAKSTKACAHLICTRVYCVPCINKLIGKAQTPAVWQTKQWLCPNCTTGNNSTLARKEGKGTGPASAASTVMTAAAAKPKKRKRYTVTDGTSKADNDKPDSLVPALRSVSDMKPIDYAVTYFKFILQREMQDAFEESEDVCFCCKDGGNVIECDWKGLNGAMARCPKVYHEDCLGYKVPEGKTWVCPRHRCQDCGVIAPYSCRFCVTSYCEDHLPKDVRRLGHATRDIATATYVMCPRCSQQAQDAFKQEKIEPDLYTKLLRRRAGKR